MEVIFHVLTRIYEFSEILVLRLGLRQAASVALTATHCLRSAMSSSIHGVWKIRPYLDKDDNTAGGLPQPMIVFFLWQSSV